MIAGSVGGIDGWGRFNGGGIGVFWKDLEMAGDGQVEVLFFSDDIDVL